MWGMRVSMSLDMRRRRTVYVMSDDVALQLQALQPVAMASLLAEALKTHLTAREHGACGQGGAEQDNQSLRPQQGDVP